jgi:zinc D-Ala-D-Ala carboxypeptidase
MDDEGASERERVSYAHWKQVPRTLSAWPCQYFQPREVACRGTGEVRISIKLLDHLDSLRRLLARPLTTLSVYRSQYHNARVGGAPMSLHVQGMAADIAIVGRDKKLIESLAQQVGFTGFGYYRTFLHIDLGRPRWWGKKWDA